jgi:chromosomal replication initiation ATPase DnaA
MEKSELLTKKFCYPELFMITESISEVLGIEKEEIFEKNRKLIKVRARHFIINFALHYTSNNTTTTAKFLEPAVSNHSTISYARKKVNNDIDTCHEIRQQWINVLLNYKQKITSNENTTNYYLSDRIDNYISRYPEGQK